MSKIVDTAFVTVVYENFEQVVWNSHMLVVRNLRHFAHYTISVMACRELIPEEAHNAKITNCSQQSFISSRTQPLGELLSYTVTSFITRIVNKIIVIYPYLCQPSLKLNKLTKRIQCFCSEIVFRFFLNLFSSNKMW